MRCYTTPASNGTNIFDPCFSASEGQYLVCPDAPWSNKWVEIDAQGNLGEVPPPTTSGLPWGVRTSTGALCVQADGATNTVAGLGLNFYCSDRTTLYGDPTRGATWSIRSETTSGKPLTTINLLTVWY